MKRKNKGGFSLVEVVISLSLIVMISVTGLTIALSSINTKVRAISRTHAQYFAENVWECFKVAENKDEFRSLLGLLDADGDAHSEIRNDTEYFICTHESGGYQFVAYIAVKYKVGERPRLDINVSDDKGSIISFFYEKGIAVPNGEGGGV